MNLNLLTHFPSWMHRKIINVEIWQFFSVFILLLLGISLKKISDYIFERKLIPLFKKTNLDIDNLFIEALSKPFGVFLLLWGIAGALAVIPLPTRPDINGFVFKTLKIAFALDFLWFVFRLVDIGVKYLARLIKRTESSLDEQIIPIISRVIKLTIGTISFLWLMQLLGYNISSLLAGLGIGGLAVALALQDTLSNFFGSIFIFLDKPFMVGDIVKIGEVEGTVEDVGFRSTRIRTYSATLVSIPNKTVSNSTIDNLSKRSKRKVCQTIRVTYETSKAGIEQIVESIKNIIEQDEEVDKENISVKFSESGNASLDIMAIYFTTNTDFGVHMKTKERINLAIMKKMEELGLSIALPTSSIYIENINSNVNKLPVSGKKTRKTRKDDNKEENLPF